MTSGGYREEVLNVLLALLLSERGIVSAPEQSLRQALHRRRHLPDVLVVFQGLRTAIEGKVDDVPSAAEIVLQSARHRVEKGIAHIGLALLYPASLRQVPFDQLADAIAQAPLRIAVLSEAGESGWAGGDLNYLAGLLRRTFDQLVQEDVVARAAEVLSSGISEFARSAFASPATRQRAARILGIGEPPRPGRKAPPEDEE